MTIPSAEQLYHEKQESTTAQLKITQQLIVLHAASCNITATLESKRVAEVIVQEFSNLLPASACFLGKWNGDENRLEFIANHCPEESGGEQPESILNVHPSLTEKILSRRNVLHISQNTPGEDENVLKAMKEYNITSLLVLPLIIENQLIGLVEVLNYSERPYATYEIVIARMLADQAVISMENAKLYQSPRQEILARQKTEEKLRYNALHDVLTNLPNRVLFLDRLEQAISRYKRFEKLEYAVLFLDLDRFKSINDSFGHVEGDRALREVATRLSASIREGDTVCRFSGDEFLILLEGELNSVVIQKITDRIQNSLDFPIFIEEQEFHITASIGIAFCVQDDIDANEYVRNANIAMCQAKKNGGGRAVIFTPTKELETKNKVELESALRMAVRKKSFYLNYQPIYNLDTLSIAGLEVLLRWKEKDAIIPPNKFIHLLETFGLMPELGLWILQTALRNYQTWKGHNQRIAQLNLSVNISNLQLVHQDFIPQLTRIIEDTKMDPSKLNLEITEHVLIEDLGLANEKICALNDLGVEVHLDDFGTGYSSLSYLNDLPIQALKIDRKFVQQVNPSEAHHGLVWSILSMARKFNVAVIAEGIETENQLRGLRYAKCQYGQGNFLSPALSEDKLLELLKTSPFST